MSEQELAQAIKDGADIQWLRGKEWLNVTGADIHRPASEYRIRPEPCSVYDWIILTAKATPWDDKEVLK